MGKGKAYTDKTLKEILRIFKCGWGGEGEWVSKGADIQGYPWLTVRLSLCTTLYRKVLQCNPTLSLAGALGVFKQGLGTVARKTVFLSPGARRVEWYSWEEDTHHCSQFHSLKKGRFSQSWSKKEVNLRFPLQPRIIQN